MTALLDGAVIDLDRVQIALDGSRWLWTCDVTESGDPLMARVDGLPGVRVLPLWAVCRDHGPVIPSPTRPTAAQCRQALEAA